MQKSELNRIVEESTRKLMQISVPPVRYGILVDVLRRDIDDPVLQRTISECRTYPMRLKLLDTLREDGTWPISKQRKIAEDAGPGPPIGWTYITMLRNLYELGECCSTKDDGRIRASIERILGWQTKEGYIPGPWSPALPLPQYNGFALRNIVRLGLLDDRRVDRLVKWLVKVQRPDGGWNIPFLEDVKYLPKYRYMSTDDFTELIERGEVSGYDPADHFDTPSCIWTTLMVVRGFIQTTSLEKMKATRRGAEFFLDRFFQRNYHSSFYKSEKNWTMLKYPTYFGSGLCALDILTFMGYGPEDPRMDKPIKWLLNARSRDGFWHRSDRPHPVTDQWISVIALSILDRYARAM